MLCFASPRMPTKTDVSASSPRWASSIIFFATSRVPASSTNFRLKDLAYTFEASRHFGYCFGFKCQTREKRTNSALPLLFTIFDRASNQLPLMLSLL